jgi:hypothetical protein
MRTLPPFVDLEPMAEASPFTIFVNSATGGEKLILVRNYYGETYCLS